jgi:hypothetical protein
MPTRWYYARDQQKKGPVASAELKALAVSGQLKPADMVLPDGAKKWVQAATIKGLFTGFQVQGLIDFGFDKAAMWQTISKKTFADSWCRPPKRVTGLWSTRPRSTNF